MAPSAACPLLALAASLLAADAQLPPEPPRELSQMTAAEYCSTLSTMAACNADLTYNCYWVGNPKKCLDVCPETRETEFTAPYFGNCACGAEACNSNQWCNYSVSSAPRCQAKCSTFNCVDPYGQNNGWTPNHAAVSKVCAGPTCDFAVKKDRHQCCKFIDCWRTVTADYDQQGRAVLKMRADDDLMPVDKYRVKSSTSGPKLQPVMMSAGQGPQGAVYVVAFYPSPGGKKQHGDPLWSVNSGECIGTLDVPEKFSWFGDNEKKKQLKQQKRNARRLASVKRR